VHPIRLQFPTPAAVDTAAPPTTTLPTKKLTTEATPAATLHRSSRRNGNFGSAAVATPICAAPVSTPTHITSQATKHLCDTNGTPVQHPRHRSKHLYVISFAAASTPTASAIQAAIVAAEPAAKSPAPTPPTAETAAAAFSAANNPGVTTIFPEATATNPPAVENPEIKTAITAFPAASYLIAATTFPAAAPPQHRTAEDRTNQHLLRLLFGNTQPGKYSPNLNVFSSKISTYALNA